MRWLTIIVLVAGLAGVGYVWVARFGVSFGRTTITKQGIQRDPPADELALWERQVRTVTRTRTTFLWFTDSSALGTAFYAAPGGLLTVAHVETVATAYGAVTADGPGGHVPARVVASDSDHDLALLSAEGAEAGPAPVMTFRASAPAAGEHAWALCAAPTRDIVPLTMIGSSTRLSEVQQNGYQKPLAGTGIVFRGRMHPGCSGAPVVDAQGLVIGVAVGAAGNQSDAVAAADVIDWLRAHGVTAQSR